MKQLLIQLYFSSALLCGLLAAGLLFSSGLRILSARLLGINYALYSLQQLLAVTILGFTWAPAMMLRPSIALALGPALYFYYLSLIKTDNRFSRLSLLHLLPFVIMLAAFLVDSPLVRWTDAMIVVSFACYFLIIVRLLLSGVTGLQHLGQYAGVAYRWLLILAGLMLITLLVEVGAWVEIGTNKPTSESRVILFGVLIFLAFNVFALVLALTRAPLVEWMHTLQDLRLTRTKSLDDAEAEQMFARWQALVLERELYKREGGVTLEQAGRMMGVPARQISIAVNRIYGGSFSQYLNDCRVREVQRLLVEQPNLPITMLMLEAGFTTKSNFNKEFQRVTGLSPGEYRKRALG
jgi:AraC-like DNA-binding protein